MINIVIWYQGASSEMLHISFCASIRHINRKQVKEPLTALGEFLIQRDVIRKTIAEYIDLRV